MKRLTKLLVIIMAAAMLIPVCGCFGEPSGPSVVDLRTPEPTDAPAPADPEAVDAFFGDWYGTYTVKSASGIYAANAGVANDCAMRAALNEFGVGSCFLAVNGLEPDAVSGSKNLFALCTAAVTENGLAVNGTIHRYPVEWTFRRENALIKLNERFGDDANGMEIEIVLARPDELAGSGIVPDAADYLKTYGFAGVIDALGGKTSELPELKPAEGRALHDFFTAAPAGSVDDPLPSGGKIVTSATGHIRLDLPENYVVLQNDVLGLVLAAPYDRVTGVDFTYTSWNTDALAYLIENAPGARDFTHYTIDGFDFYGAFIEGPQGYGSSTVYKLCGVNGYGKLVIITMTMNMDMQDAMKYASVGNDSFRQLILGAKFY